MELKDWVLAARKKKGWTQSDLGDHLNVTKGNVSAWENGRHEPSYGQMKSIAALTGLRLPDDPLPLDVAQALGSAPEPLRLQLENMLRAALGLPLRDIVLATPPIRVIHAPATPDESGTGTESRSAVQEPQRPMPTAPSGAMEENQWHSGQEPTRVGKMSRTDPQQDVYPAGPRKQPARRVKL